MAEGMGLLFAMAVVLGVIILLAFVFFGVGLILLGCMLLVGLILGAIALPCLFPCFLPLLIIWIIVAIMRRGNKQKNPEHTGS